MRALEKTILFSILVITPLHQNFAIMYCRPWPPGKNVRNLGRSTKKTRLKLGLHQGGFPRNTARQSSLFNVTVCAAAVHCEVMRIEAGPIARKAKITRGNGLPDESI